MRADRGIHINRRGFLAGAAVSGLALLATACREKSPYRTISIEAPTPVPVQKIKIGEVDLSQTGTEIQIVTRDPKTGRAVEAEIAEACDAVTRKAVDSKSIVRRLRVTVENCINSERIKNRLTALQS